MITDITSCACDKTKAFNTQLSTTRGSHLLVEVCDSGLLIGKIILDHLTIPSEDFDRLIYSVLRKNSSHTFFSIEKGFDPLIFVTWVNLDPD